MKKSILNIGTALNKAEQKSINGGTAVSCIAWNWETLSYVSYTCGQGSAGINYYEQKEDRME